MACCRSPPQRPTEQPCRNCRGLLKRPVLVVTENLAMIFAALRAAVPGVVAWSVGARHERAVRDGVLSVRQAERRARLSEPIRAHCHGIEALAITRARLPGS